VNPRTAFIAAPLLTFAYGVIRIVDGLDGSRGPGLAWTTGHLAFLGAMVAFVFVFVQMRRLAGRDTVSTLAAVIGTAGALALSGQFAIDVVAGLLSTDHLGMSLLIADIRSTPGVTVAVYDVGPYLFYIGQLALVVRLAVMRRISAWTPLLVVFDLVTPFVDKDLIPLGAIVLLISFVSIAKRMPATAEGVPALV
jgi:hypothetical protein